MSTQDLSLEILQEFGKELLERWPRCKLTTLIVHKGSTTRQVRLIPPKLPFNTEVHYNISLDGSDITLVRLSKSHRLNRDKRTLPDKGIRNEHPFDLSDPKCFEAIAALLEKYFNEHNEYPFPRGP